MSKTACRYHVGCAGHRMDKFEPTLTKQAFKEECDINNIIERARNGQDISGMINARVARYGDFTNIPDYRSALDVVIRAEGAFMELEAKVRERFGNDPAKMVDFLQDPENYDEAVKMGLLDPEKVKARKEAEKPVKSKAEGLPDDPEKGSKKAASGKPEAEPRGSAAHPKGESEK